MMTDEVQSFQAQAFHLSVEANKSGSAAESLSVSSKTEHMECDSV